MRRRRRRWRRRRSDGVSRVSQSDFSSPCPSMYSSITQIDMSFINLMENE